MYLAKVPRDNTDVTSVAKIEPLDVFIKANPVEGDYPHGTSRKRRRWTNRNAAENKIWTPSKTVLFNMIPLNNSRFL